MMRLGAAFIAICMVLIAGSLGAILYLAVGLSVMEASVVAIAVLTALVVYNAATTRIRDQEMVSQQIADLSRGTADLARQVGEIGRRIEAAEAVGSEAGNQVRAAVAPMATEIETLGNLVKELAESVAAHEAVLARNAVTALMPAGTPATQAPVEAAPTHPVHSAEVRDLDAAELERLAASRFRGMDRARATTMVASAVEDNRVDLYLQPIVSLPQRKVRFYEAVARLRTEDGEVLSPY